MEIVRYLKSLPEGIHQTVYYRGKELEFLWFFNDDIMDLIDSETKRLISIPNTCWGNVHLFPFSLCIN